MQKMFCELKEFKMAGDANSTMGQFSGYASVFNSIDLGGDQIKRGAYSKTLNEWSSKGLMPQMLFYHSMDEIIGEWTKMEENEHGLYVEGRLWVKGDERIETAVKALNVLKSNSVKGLSIGYRVRDEEIQEFAGGRIRVLKDIDLLEVSIAPWAMEPKASVTAVKSLIGEAGQLLSKREVEKALRDAGLSTRQAKAFIASGYDSVSRDEEQLDDILASIDQFLTILKG